MFVSGSVCEKPQLHVESRRGGRHRLYTLAFVALAQTLIAAPPVTPSQSFGQVQINGSPAAQILSFSFTALTATPTFSLAYGIEFKPGIPTCTLATKTCTLTVSFLPQYSGLRQDAVNVLDQSGNLLANKFLYGIGLGPQVSFHPGVISTFAGAANSSYSGGGGGPAVSPTFANPQGLAVDAINNVYVADSVNQVIRKIAVDGTISTVTGIYQTAGYTGNGGSALQATLNTPTAVALDAAGNLYIADQGNNVIRVVNAATQRITTLAGGSTTPSGQNGLGDNGPATSAILSGPGDVAVDAGGNVFIADSFHGLIRKVDTSGIITVFAGGGAGGGTDGVGGGGLATNALLNNPSGLALDAGGNLYIADTGHHMVRSVVAGIITEIAGTGLAGYSGDLGPAQNAQLNSPYGIRVDAAGNIYISDFGNNVIRELLAASGTIVTIAGTGAAGYSGDGGIPTSAQLRNPTSVAPDNSGNIYVADYSNNVVRKLSFQMTPITFGTVDVGEMSSSQVLSAFNIGNQSLHFNSLTISGSFRQQASGYTDCSSTSVVLPGSDCVVGIAFVPATNGSLTGSITLTDNTLNIPGSIQTATLSGTGAVGPIPQAALSTNTLAFGNQSLGVSSTSSITLTNTGPVPLNIQNIWLTGANAADFHIGTCPATIAAGANCSLTVRFAPQALNTRTATVVFNDDLASSPQIVVLTGTGIAAGTASFSTSALAFSIQKVGTTSTAQTFTLANAGTTSLAIFSLALQGTNAGDFNLTTTCGAPIPVSSSCAVSVSFSPLASGNRTASLIFTDSASDSPQTMTLTGFAATATFTKVSAGADGSVWGVGSAGEIYYYDPKPAAWQQAPSGPTIISVGNRNSIWGLNAAGTIFRWNASTQTWDLIWGSLSQMAVGADGDVWGLNSAGLIFHFDVAIQNWNWIPGSLSQIAVGFDGAMWGLNAAHQLYRFNPGKQGFDYVPAVVTQVSVGADGDLWGLNGGSISRFNRLTQTWSSIFGVLSQISVGSGSNIWGVNPAGQVYQYNLQIQNWVFIGSGFNQVAAAQNGAAWGVNSSGNLYCFSGSVGSTQALHQLPGSLTQLSVASDNAVWGANSLGQIYTFNPKTQNWIWLPSQATQVAVTRNGNVWGINSAGQIYRFNTATQNWNQMPGVLSQIYVAANGDVWGLNKAGWIYRFNFSLQNWIQMPGVLSQLSIGEDGTVWGLNSASQIYRFNTSTQNWDSIPGFLAQLSVGSKDNIWGVNAAGLIFRFNSSIQNWTYIAGSLSHIAVGFDGAVWGVDSNNHVWQFNSQTQTFTQVPGSLRQIAVASDSAIWGLDASGSIFSFY